MPTLRIDGDSPGLPLLFVASGPMADDFEEGYRVEIAQKDKAVREQPGQTPHPPDMNYDKGKFENLHFTVVLFSGCEVNNQQVFEGSRLNLVSQLIFRLSMPRQDGASFIGPPLVTVTYGNFWRGRGLFQSATFKSRGSWDFQGYPLLMEIELEFARHFGGQAGVGGIYGPALATDLRQATAEQFKFFN